MRHYVEFTKEGRNYCAYITTEPCGNGSCISDTTQSGCFNKVLQYFKDNENWHNAGNQSV